MPVPGALLCTRACWSCGRRGPSAGPSLCCALRPGVGSGRPRWCGRWPPGCLVLVPHRETLVLYLEHGEKTVGVGLQESARSEVRVVWDLHVVSASGRCGGGGRGWSPGRSAAGVRPPHLPDAERQDASLSGKMEQKLPAKRSGKVVCNEGFCGTRGFPATPARGGGEKPQHCNDEQILANNGSPGRGGGEAAPAPTHTLFFRITPRGPALALAPLTATSGLVSQL